MQYQEIRQKLSEYFVEAIKRKKNRMEVAGRLTGQEIDYYRSGVAFGSDGFSLGLGGDPQLKSLFSWSGLEVSERSKDYETIRVEYERAYSSYCQHLLDYDQSLGAYDFETKKSFVTSMRVSKAANTTTLSSVN